MRYGRSVKVMKMIFCEMSSGFWLGSCYYIEGRCTGHDADMPSRRLLVCVRVICGGLKARYSGFWLQHGLST